MSPITIPPPPPHRLCPIVACAQAGKVAREGVGKIKSAKGGKHRVEARLDTNKHRTPGRQKASKKVGLLQALDE